MMIKEELQKLREAYKKPLLTKDDFGVDVDEKNREIRFQVQNRGRKEYFDKMMDLVHELNKKKNRANNILKKLNSAIKKAEEEAKSALNVLDPDTNEMRSLISVIEETGARISEFSDEVTDIGQFTLRIMSNKYIWTITKQIEPTPEYLTAIENLIARLMEIDHGTGSQIPLINMIRYYIKMTVDGKDPYRKDLGIKQMSESLLYEFQLMKSIKEVWQKVKAKFALFVRKIQRMGDDFSRATEDVHNLMEIIYPARLRAMTEEKEFDGVLKESRDDGGIKFPFPVKRYIDNGFWEISKAVASKLCGGVLPKHGREKLSNISTATDSTDGEKITDIEIWVGQTIDAGKLVWCIHTNSKHITDKMWSDQFITRKKIRESEEVDSDNENLFVSPDQVIRKYSIKSIDEECQCPECGYPLYLNDDAFESDDTESGFCSKTCLLACRDANNGNYIR